MIIKKHGYVQVPSLKLIWNDNNMCFLVYIIFMYNEMGDKTVRGRSSFIGRNDGSAGDEKAVADRWAGIVMTGDSARCRQ